MYRIDLYWQHNWHIHRLWTLFRSQSIKSSVMIGCVFCSSTNMPTATDDGKRPNNDVVVDKTSKQERTTLNDHSRTQLFNSNCRQISSSHLYSIAGSYIHLTTLVFNCLRSTRRRLFHSRSYHLIVSIVSRCKIYSTIDLVRLLVIYSKRWR